MKTLVIWALLGTCLVWSKDIARPSDPLLVFHKKGTIYTEVRFGYMKVQLFDFRQFYKAADPESWHVSEFKELERSFKIKKIDKNEETDHVIRLNPRKRGGYDKNLWVESAFYFSIELKSLAQSQKTKFLEVDKYFTFREGLKLLQKKMSNDYQPLFHEVKDLDCYTQSLEDGKLVVAIQVPFIKKDDHGQDLITRINVPIMYKDEIFGEIDPEYKILQHPESQEYSLMTNEEFSRCKYHLPVNLLCREKFEPNRHPDLEDTCDGALFFKQFKKAGSLCFHNLIQPHYFSIEITRNEHLVYTPKPVVAKLICEGKIVQNVPLDKLQIVDIPRIKEPITLDGHTRWKSPIEEDDDCMVIDEDGEVELIPQDVQMMFLKGTYILHELSVNDLETMWPELTSKVLKKMVQEGDSGDNLIKVDDSNEKNSTLSFVLDKKDEL